MRLLLPALFLLLLPGSAFPCTTFLVDDGGELAFGKSYDWDMGQGLVLINKRGVEKRALVLDPRDRPATWTSKHASITFNQYGREFPNGGMNDAGLVVEIMWLEGSRYPARDRRPAVNELQWIQYQLDNFATVSQMRAEADAIRVSPANGRVHYLACDAGGDCSAFEYLDGRLVISTEARALTNDTYARSRRHLERQKGRIPRSSSSLDRFVRARLLAGEEGEGPVVDRAFTILDRVRIRGYSKWNIVYEPKARRVHFRTAKAPSIKALTLDAETVDCKTPVMMADIDGDGVDLSPYDPKVNARLVDRGLSKLIEHLPNGAERLVAAYPGTTTCRP